VLYSSIEGGVRVRQYGVGICISWRRGELECLAVGAKAGGAVGSINLRTGLISGELGTGSNFGGCCAGMLHSSTRDLNVECIILWKHGFRVHVGLVLARGWSTLVVI